MRRTTALITSPLLAVALLATAPTTAGAAGPGAGEASGTAAVERAAPKKKAKPAKPGKKCQVRLKKPRKKVPSKRFATCVVRAMEANRTVHVSNRFDDGTWNKGPARFLNGHTEASVTYSQGMRLVVRNRKAWVKNPGRPWVRAVNGGDPEQQHAWSIQELWVALSSSRAYRSYLRSSSTGWTWTGKSRRINGVRARQYTGTPRILGQSFDRYLVWVDKWDRPIRIESTITMMGITASGTQDFTKWGGKVKIKPPKGV